MVDNITGSKDYTKKLQSEMGEINYLRDSDEDPDDDLDIWVFIHMLCERF